MIKSLIKKLARSAGYTIVSNKYVVRHFQKQESILKLDFDHVVSKYLLFDKDPESQFVFIQVGAFDGVQCDPLNKYINKYDWKGVMLEPQETPFNQLKQMYKDRADISVKNAAISKEVGKAVLYTLLGNDLPEWAKGMASFIKENVLKHKYIFPQIEERIKEREVDTLTFEKLLFDESIAELDLLQIDTEGYDAEILNLFPFQMIKPKIIHFESKHIARVELEKTLDLLINFGYSIARDGEEDMIAVL